ncbi:2'-5' RNA ligase family protein [Arthrobacter yangruifuii]|uniref:2'-5' RNA ligase family protein n=1 Tax=Arthrobacter yangruifuii TaxID=2606616 RepID=UPI0011B491C6|nr:hypothetical protein [Arthrobacter yangruifuii]
MPESDPPGFDANLRLYAQMKPDAASLAHLVSLQGVLPSGGRLVPRRQLHGTLIHFGKVMDVYRVIREETGISRAAYEPLLGGYIARTEALLPSSSSFRLEPAGLAGFGARGSTLVVEYQPTAELTALHGQLFTVLVDFLTACGVSDTAAFLAADPNFMFASTLRPHITLARGYSGPLPALPLEPVRLIPMPVVYPGH